jgi:hypothetical protein
MRSAPSPPSSRPTARSNTHRYSILVLIDEPQSYPDRRLSSPRPAVGRIADRIAPSWASSAAPTPTAPPWATRSRASRTWRATADERHPILSELLRRDVASDPVITGVTADSRKVAPGSLFVALPGSAADGRAFIPQALSQGAAAVLAPSDTPMDMAPVLVTSGDVRRAYALAARSFYGAQPATCVAITGTNGKTSVAAFCRQIWAGLGLKSASMGTLGVVGTEGNVKTYS